MTQTLEVKLSPLAPMFYVIWKRLSTNISINRHMTFNQLPRF